MASLAILRRARATDVYKRPFTVVQLQGAWTASQTDVAYAAKHPLSCLPTLVLDVDKLHKNYHRIDLLYMADGLFKYTCYTMMDSHDTSKPADSSCNITTFREMRVSASGCKQSQHFRSGCFH